jgi:hypothetical protein
MLDPQDRTVLLEALAPPDGYTFDEGIGTTYTLDLISLLSVPLAFTQFEWDDAKGHLTSNPVLLMEALRRHINRLTIFCQAGRIAIPKPPNALFGYLEESVVEVTTGRPFGIFHPKLWALRYTNESTAEVRYRLLCLSRNLTNDRCWDLSLVLEGQLVERKNAYALNHPLGRFFETLPSLAVRAVSPVVQQRATRIAEELRRVDFAGNIPEPFEEIGFHPIGIEGHRGSPLPEYWDRGLIISPFMDQKQAEYLPEGTKGSVLVSRPEELDKLSKEALAAFGEVLVVAPTAEGELEPDQQDDAAMDGPPRGLHAKLFVCETGWNSHLFVGSANATTMAFKENVEFLIELVGRRKKVGIDQFLQPGEGQAALRNLLIPYESPTEPVLENPAERLLEKLLDSTRTMMASAGWRLSARGPETGPWHLGLVRPDGPALNIPAEVRLRVWPVTLPEASSARPLTVDSTEIHFAEVSAANLTSFLACEAEGTVNGITASARFVINLPLEGAPTGRREAILRLILDDPQKVLRFLQFLLDDGTSESFELNGPISVLNGGSNGHGPNGFVLLESLLRALATAPKRLDEVETVLRELGSDVDAHTRLPDGLLEVWPAIWAARGMIPT